MSLRVSGRFCKVWDIEVNDNGYAKVNLGTSRKDKEGNYINTNWWGVVFVGEAKEFGANLTKGDVIEVVSGQLENVYNKEKKVSYFNMVVFEAKMENQENVAPSNKKQVKTPPVDTDSDEFPFR